MKELWVDKYSPQTLDGYVFKDQNQKKKIERWVAEGALPHMLLSGAPGTGKSTLIKVLLNEIKVDPFDVLTVNASKDNGVDFIKETITKFAETMGYGEMRYIFLDEADGLSPDAQKTLRGTMEKYSKNVRFLLTCNYLHKIIPAIQSRGEIGKMSIEKLDTDEFYTKLIDILTKEEVEIEFDSLEKIVSSTYPDLRRGISMVQANSVTGKLVFSESIEKVTDYILDMVALFRAKKYKEARELICKQARIEEYEDIFRFMYRNLDMWGDDEQVQNECIIIIRDGLVKHVSCADPELNLSATLVQLEMAAKGNL